MVFGYGNAVTLLVEVLQVGRLDRDKLGRCFSHVSWRFFNWRQFEPEVILLFIYWYLRFRMWRSCRLTAGCRWTMLGAG
jgi:hypothetical protein